MSESRKYTEVNSITWDRWADSGNEWTRPISHEVFVQAQKGKWDVLLTPCIPVPHAWFGRLAGKKVLGLASGGGQQMPVFAALGAECTVFDNSDRQLASERLVAEREHYAIKIVQGDMTRGLPFDEASFDLIFHPVSNCYIEQVCPVWNECFRILKNGGALLAGFDNGLNFLFEDIDKEPLIVVNKLPFNPLGQSLEQYNRMADSDEGIQFSHSLEEQIGGQLKAGFILTDLYEDRDKAGYGALRDYTPQYMATRSIKRKSRRVQ